MAALSKTDKANLTLEQQAQVAELKKQWAAASAAGDQAGMDAAHQQAEAIRASAGYTGGSAGVGYSKLSANNGGQTADQVRQWAEDYNATNWDPKRGWVNGYSTAMNTRSKANYIRQQMLANSQAWHNASEADKEYLHQQNVELAKVLADYTGQSEKNYSYDPQAGTWWTWSGNYGYGNSLDWTMPNVVRDWQEHYGYTDEDRKRWDADTSRYFNFVDTGVANRKAMDESSGFTGAYTQFVNGPYSYLMTMGSRKTNPDLYTNDMPRFGDIQYDADGNVVPIKPVVWGNNDLTDYTRRKAAYTLNGVIQPNILSVNKYSTDPRAGVRTGVYSGVDPALGYVDAGLFTGAADVAGAGGGYAASGKPLSSMAGGSVSGGGTYAGYIEQLYAAKLQAELEQLQSAYLENIAALEAENAQLEGSYDQQKRQTSGTSAKQAAIWRETANAYGLNSGAVGQAALAQSNQLQGDLSSLRAAEAAAQAELQRQSQLLRQKYQSQIQQALAENDYQKVNALYEEAVRAEEALQEQAQFNANLTLQHLKLLTRG